jgi:hypothetical protein
MLVIVFHTLRGEGMSEEALEEFALQIQSGRSPAVHDLMG